MEWFKKITHVFHVAHYSLINVIINVFCIAMILSKLLVIVKKRVQKDNFQQYKVIELFVRIVTLLLILCILTVFVLVSALLINLN